MFLNPLPSNYHYIISTSFHLSHISHHSNEIQTIEQGTARSQETALDTDQRHNSVQSLYATAKEEDDHEWLRHIIRDNVQS